MNEAEDRRIELGLLGFAHFHQNHWAKVFLSDPRVRVVGVWDDDGDRLQKAASEYCLRSFVRVEDLLSRCDAAAICSETESHPRLLELCCRSKVDVLCEKPAATNPDLARAMKRAIRASGILYYQSFPQRHIPSNKLIKAVLDSGELGRITHVRKRHGHNFGLIDLEKRMPWIVDPGKAGGGAFLDEGIHEADILRWYFGDPLSVCADFSHAGTYPVETSGAALYRFPGDLICVLECGWNWQAAGPTTEIYGEKGAILQSLTDCSSNSGGGICPHLSMFDAATREWRKMDIPWDFSTIHTLAPKDFIDILVAGGTPASGIEEGLGAAEMIEGAYLSHRERRSVGFPLG